MATREETRRKEYAAKPAPEGGAAEGGGESCREMLREIARERVQALRKDFWRELERFVLHFVLFALLLLGVFEVLKPHVAALWLG